VGETLSEESADAEVYEPASERHDPRIAEGLHGGDGRIRSCADGTEASMWDVGGAT
tara:strand:- start:1648 stop:1815 length:168 start_codon:yes stop_codon:yes gene_type:complete